ncbi:MAG: hypothetical protein GX306_11320 [Clostridiales bacterium]|jgi:hypothetical protein|nr:hypothetical protein [Clostridiales bacterium]
MFNPTKLFKIKNAWDTFARNHPKFAMFLNAIHQTGLEEGTIIEINVTTASGKTLSSNMKLTKSDMDLFRELSELSRG